jgi:predicted NodU family carbamoyl transferase
MYIPSNTSPEEFFNYYCTEVNAVRFYAEGLNDQERYIKELQQSEKDAEVVSEQLGFAKELLEILENELNTCTKLSQFKKAFMLALENSMLER